MDRSTALQAMLFFFALAGLTSCAPAPQERAPAKKNSAVKTVSVGPNISVVVEDKKAVRVVIDAYVCLREGSLEHLLTRRLGKEHEAILAAPIDGRDLHAALLLAGAKPGRPVRFNPEAPPTGTPIKITLLYKDKDGKEIKVPARQWVRNIKTRKDLETEWVFAGSRFLVNSDDPGVVHYLANDGDIICVANFEAALLDLPILSTSSGEVDYEAHTERIPPAQTPVQVILEPVRIEKK